LDKLAHEIPAHVLPALGRIDLAREPDFALGALTVSPSRLEVAGGGARRALQRRVMQMLVALARSPDKVVSQHELISRCWGGLSVSDDAIGRCIAQLRQLAQAWPEPPFAIETIPGVGYRLDAVRIELGAQGAASRRRGISRPVLALAAAATLVAVGVGAWLTTRAPTDRVAVIPFQAAPGDGPARAFAHGLAEEIVGAATSNRQPVISSTESAAVVGPGGDAARRRLGVTLMVGGTVASDGPAVRAQVHLDDAAQHLTLWSKTFEGPAARPAVLQAVIAARISDVLAWAFEARRARPGPLDAPATVSLLQASDTMANPTDPADWNADKEATADALREVTRRAPQSGVGHARLALDLSEDPAHAPEAISEARRALTLDPHAAEAYMALSQIETPSHWAARDHLLAQAVAADPDFSFAVLYRSRLLEGAGRNREALRLAQRAVALRPLFAGGVSTLGDLLVQTGQIPEGRGKLDAAAALWPANTRLKFERLWVVVGLDDFNLALRLIEDPQTRPPSMNDHQMAVWRAALTAARSHNPAAMSAAARAVRRDADAGGLSPADAVGLCSALGGLDCAFAEVGRFHAKPDDTSLLFGDIARPMRHDRRFMDVAAGLGLVDFWRATGRWPDFCAEPGLPYDCRAWAPGRTA